MTIPSITGITPGNNTITVTGSGKCSALFSFAYTFRLAPASQEPDVSQLVDVNTVGLTIRGDNPSWFGFLINFVTDALSGLFQPNNGQVQPGCRRSSTRRSPSGSAAADPWPPSPRPSRAWRSAPAPA